MSLRRILPQEARALVESGDWTYLDVRSRAEFRDGHAPGAVNIPWAEPDPVSGQMVPNARFVSEVERKFKRDAQLVTACARGGRSLRAAQALQEAGFTAIVDMRAGFLGEIDPSGQVSILGWKALGLPVVSEGD